MTDMELVQAYHEGSSGAFVTLFQRHKGAVFNFALRMLSNRADAEDITSDVFVQLANRKFMATGQAKLTTWLFTVARNACVSRLRSFKFQVSFWSRNDDGDFAEWEPADPNDGPGDLLKKKEIAASLRKAIATLPEEQKEALILREYHGSSYAEIGEVLACSLEKVKILIFRARETLRADLAGSAKEAL